MFSCASHAIAGESTRTEDINLAELSRDLLEQASDLRFVADVELDCSNLTAGLDVCLCVRSLARVRDFLEGLLAAGKED
jgi:hypothetical protein